MPEMPNSKPFPGFSTYQKLPKPIEEIIPEPTPEPPPPTPDPPKPDLSIDPFYKLMFKM
jgi:hypothetical protein